MRTLAAIVLASLLAVGATVQAFTIPMEITAPCTNDDSLMTPLTDLKQIVLYGQRCGRPDTVRLGTIPAMGRECDTLSFDLQIDSTGTTFDLWAFSEDVNGNRSRRPVWCQIAVPQQDYSAGLWGQYYADTTFTDYRLSRADQNIDFRWEEGAPAPNMPRDYFTVRWTGSIRTTVSGQYKFKVLINNGARMWVGGNKILDDWADLSERTATVYATLNGGSEYDFMMEYKENLGIARIVLSWTPPGGTEAVVPPSAFVH